MTSILCAPVEGGLRDETAQCLAAVPAAEIVWLERGDRYAYWAVIRERWQAAEDLLIIEQDMVFTPAMVDAVITCPQDWCCHGYLISTTRTTGCLGFTKFSAEVQRLLKPEILESAMRQCTLCHGEYWHLDFHITETARVAGFWAHDHGDITHLHEYQPAAKLMEVGDRTSAEFRRDITGYLKSQGWQGPGAHPGHDHVPGCACVWAD